MTDKKAVKFTSTFNQMILSLEEELSIIFLKIDCSSRMKLKKYWNIAIPSPTIGIA